MRWPFWLVSKMSFQVAKIETEKMLITMVETELEKRKAEGRYHASFRGQSHFFGWVLNTAHWKCLSQLFLMQLVCYLADMKGDAVFLLILILAIAMHWAMDLVPFSKVGRQDLLPRYAPLILSCYVKYSWGIFALCIANSAKTLRQKDRHQCE